MTDDSLVTRSALVKLNPATDAKPERGRMERMLDRLPAEAVGLRLARINRKEELILCEAIRFAEGRTAVDTVLRRARISGRVEIDGKIANHFADVLDDNGDIVETVTLDSQSYKVLKNRWMRCKVEKM